MMDELEQIDLLPIADLVQIKGEEEVLRDRLEKMEGRKEKVSELVYRRVRQDYETRKAALEAESRPLKEKARREYATLQILREKAERAVEEVALEREEIEFRRDLGELPDDQFRERFSTAEQRLAERKRDLDAVAEIQAKFVAAFHSEEELSTPAPSVPSAPPVPLAPTPSVDATVFIPQAGPAPADATALGPPSATVALSEEELSLAKPRLVIVKDDKPGDEHVLKAGITVLGRSRDADIQVPFPEVSRRHAQVIWEANDYVINDLESQIGVFVNGQKTKKQILKDGDVVQIGPQKFIFRA
jgi:hypothetical protein